MKYDIPIPHFEITVMVEMVQLSFGVERGRIRSASYGHGREYSVKCAVLRSPSARAGWCLLLTVVICLLSVGIHALSPCCCTTEVRVLLTVGLIEWCME